MMPRHSPDEGPRGSRANSDSTIADLCRAAWPEILPDAGDPHPPSGPQRLIGRYEIREVVQAGGQGTVYRAWDPDLHREVALKVSHARVDDYPGQPRLHEEGALLARLNQPGLAQVYDSGVVAGHAFLVMEFVSGATLDDYRRDGLSMREIRRILVEISAALAAVHEAGILHLDLKPENVIVMSDGRCKLIDFGMGALLSTLQGIPVNLVAGTWETMSPEQRRGRVGEWSRASDLFSLAGLAGFLLTGRLPFPEHELADAELREHLAQYRIAVASACPDSALRRVLVEALRFDSVERLGDIAVFQSALHARGRQRSLSAACVVLGALALIAGLWGGGGHPGVPIDGWTAVVAERPVDQPAREHLLSLTVSGADGHVPTVGYWSPSTGLVPLQVERDDAGPLGEWKLHGDRPWLRVATGDSLAALIAAPSDEELVQVADVLRTSLAAMPPPSPPASVEIEEFSGGGESPGPLAEAHACSGSNRFANALRARGLCHQVCLVRLPRVAGSDPVAVRMLAPSPGAGSGCPRPHCEQEPEFIDLSAASRMGPGFPVLDQWLARDRDCE